MWCRRKVPVDKEIMSLGFNPTVSNNPSQHATKTDASRDSQVLAAKTSVFEELSDDALNLVTGGISHENIFRGFTSARSTNIKGAGGGDEL